MKGRKLKMKNITMIAAVGKNLELGKDNDLIWHFKGDMKFFRDHTLQKPIIMGRNTLESLPKLLPERKHIVLTKKNIEIPGVFIVHSPDDLLNYIRQYGKEVMVIGGASIYPQMLPYADKMLLTEVNAESKADVYFPEFYPEEWKKEVLEEKEENNITYKHLVYTRK